MVVAMALILVFLQRSLRRDPNYWAKSPFEFSDAGGMSLVLWIIIVAAGRWVGFTTDVLLHAN
jgi:hypothetical protein